MKAPNKIYIDTEYPREPYGIRQEDSNDVCYIRKDLVEHIIRETLGTQDALNKIRSL